MPRMNSVETYGYYTPDRLETMVRLVNACIAY